MKYKAIALDLDGTLTDHNKKLPAKNIEAVDKAIRCCSGNKPSYV